MAGTQGTALNHQALGAGGFGASTSESHGTVAISEAVLDRVLPIGHYPDKRLRKSPSLSVKEASSLVRELQNEGKTSDSAHIYWPVELLSRNVGCGCHFVFLTFFTLLVSPGKELYTHLESRFL